jgi:hypothetical protein
MKKTTSQIVISAAVAGIIGASALTGISAHAEGKYKCQGANGCGGKGECATKGKNSCHGKNSCKGKGWVHTANKEACKTAKADANKAADATEAK